MQVSQNEIEWAQNMLREIEERKLKYPQFVDRNFPRQANFIEDISRKKAALCTRRAGKSNGVARMMLQWLHGGVGDVLYLGLTRDTVRRLMWEPILKPLNRALGINAVPNETKMSLTNSETSHIYCLGADADEEEMKKFLGGKYIGVVIDEAQSFRIDMGKLINQVLRAALTDLRGTICLTGTPDDLTSGMFYEITKQAGERLGGWSVHEWSAEDNPYMKVAWAEEISEIMKENPRAEETPWFQRMYRGKWVTDTSALVYKFTRDNNVVEKLPEGDWTYVLGIDLGFNNASAFTLYAYSEFNPNLYLVSSRKKSGLIIADVAEEIKYYRDRYGVAYLPCDPASKQVVEELKQRYGIPLISAEKSEKDRYIEMMNSDFIQGRLKLVDSGTKELQEEYFGLIWDRQAAKKIEHPSCANDCADSALYGWRHCRQYVFEGKAVVFNTPEEDADEFWERESHAVGQNKHKPFWERA